MLSFTLGLVVGGAITFYFHDHITAFARARGWIS